MKPRHDHERADQTRGRILRAAVRQFSQHGLAGARIDAIAHEAGVNKALLYYYFRAKSGLYNAALEDASSYVMASATAALDAGASAGESLLHFTLNHFDRMASQHEFQGLLQHEMVRIQRGESRALPVFARSVFAPLFKRTETIIREGIRAGELCQVDPLQIMYSALGANVFYFLSAPMMRLALPFEPLDARSLKLRRKAAIEFLGKAIFRDRSHGDMLAQRVLADVPEPTFKNFPLGRKCS
jgi:TetR/AcrR family transcriptional regulator